MLNRSSLRRLLTLPPAVLTAWALVVGLPMAPDAGTPGHLESSTVAVSAPEAEARGRDGSWTVGLDLAAGTQMVALTWATGATATEVRLRGRHDDAWSEWQDASPESGDDGPDTGGNGRDGVGPFWLGHDGADRVEVSVAKGELPDLRVLRMKWIEPTGGDGQQAGAEPAGPSIQSRSVWGANRPWRGDNPGCTAAPIEMKQLKFAVVHHTVSGNDYSASQVPGILAGIYEYHTGSRGWCDIAYNFVVDRFGTVWQGRSGNVATPVQGGHAKGFNTDSVGIVFLGQYQPGDAPSAVQPSSASVAALQNLLAWKFSIHGINPQGNVTVRSNGSTKYADGVMVTIPTIIGHRNVGLSSCPGDWLYAKLPSVRANVAAAVAASRTPSKWKPFSEPRSYAARQYVDFLARFPTNTEQALWASSMQRSGTPGSTLIARLQRTGEFDSRAGSVARLYLAYFKRIPDHAGLRHWVGKVRAGTSRDSVSRAFATSSEFKETYGSLSNSAFVSRVYANVLGRAPDAQGGAYWTKRLDRSSIGRGSLMLAFSDSQEFKDRSVANIRVILTTDLMLNRAVTKAGYDMWSGFIRQGTSVAKLIDEFLRSSEYAARF